MTMTHPIRSPDARRLISDAKLQLLSADGDLTRLLDLDEEQALGALPNVSLMLHEARLALQQAGRYLERDVLEKASIAHILEPGFVAPDAQPASSVSELLGELAHLQSLCAALSGGHEDEDEATDASPFVRAERHRKKGLKLALALGLLALVIGSYQAAMLPEKAAHEVQRRLEAACLNAPQCLAPVREAIAECAETQLRWMSLVPGRYSSSNHRDPIRDWAALVDCLNHAAGSEHFQLGAADTILTRTIDATYE